MPEIVIPSGSSTAAAAATASRYQALMTAQGYYAETSWRGSTSTSGTAGTSGQVYFMAIGLLAGDVVTNLLTCCQGAGSGFSGIGMKVGLYSKAGVRLALSADVSAAHGSTGPKTNALTAPYTVLTTDGYYVAVLSVATTCPSLLIGAPAVSTNGLFAAGTIGSGGAQASQTDLPAPATIAFAAATAHNYWMGVS